MNRRENLESWQDKSKQKPKVLRPTKPVPFDWGTGLRKFQRVHWSSQGGPQAPARDRLDKLMRGPDEFLRLLRKLKVAG